MKKIMLIFGIAAFSSAAGQQKDIFDIQQHLIKKTGKSKIKEQFGLLPGLKKMAPIPYLGNNKPGRLSHVLPNGDKVIILPIDNMPCVQPDMKQFFKMPSLQPDIRQFRSMPNASAQFIYFAGYVKADQLPALSRSSYKSME